MTLVETLLLPSGLIVTWGSLASSDPESSSLEVRSGSSSKGGGGAGALQDVVFVRGILLSFFVVS